MTITHPLDPLTEEEFSVFTQAAVDYFVKKLGITEKDIRHVYTALHEPPKEQVLAFLGIGQEATNQLPPRQAEVCFRNGLTSLGYEVYLTLTGPKTAEVDRFVALPEGTHTMMSVNEMANVLEITKNSPEVIKAAAEVGVDAEHIEVDPWTLGFDPRFPQNKRLLMGLLFTRLEPGSNHYGNPLDFQVVVDPEEKKVVRLDFPAMPKNTLQTPKDQITTEYVGNKLPAPLDEDPLKASGRERVKPDLSPKEYIPELMEKDPNFEYREPVKPLNIVQPEGVSFKVDGRRISWQGWDFHVGFNPREGLTIDTVTFYDSYEKQKRPLFYRLSCVEMLVPYGDPAWPHPRKHAFDVGEGGLGILANELTLGCDCVGTIHYMDFVLAGEQFKPYTLKNCVCIHEEDDGFLWKHMDFREFPKSNSVRSRKLIVQFVATLANYEYAFNWIFRQDATVELEVKLTGILNTNLAAPDEISPYGTTVAKGVMAHNHQHLFSVYANPMLDGVENSLVETDVLADPHPTGSPENFAGNAFYAKSTTIETTDDSVRDIDPFKHRTWSFVNLNKTHPTSGKPVGYKILPNSMPPLLPRPDSMAAKRGTFATHGLWVAPRHPEELYPSGKHLYISGGLLKDTVDNWVKGSKPIKQKDLSAWLTIGVTHIPRPEDFPMMPKEWINVLFKPFSFYQANPTNDVRPTPKNDGSKLACCSKN